MATVTVHTTSPAIVRRNGRDHNTKIRPGTYPCGTHYTKRDGLEVAWITTTELGYVALWHDPGTPRTWDVDAAPKND